MPDSNVPDKATIVTNATSAENEWPVIGPETLALRSSPAMARLGDAADSVIEEARQVLRRCGKPRSVPSREVGLVTGYVQSGKTLNYTCLCALARDNGYPLIIIITGISTNLLDQSTGRLQRDLRLLERQDRKWLPIAIDTRHPTPAQLVADALGDWEDSNVPESRRQSVLITVMKNHRNLDYLVQALSNVPLERVPALVIDDEGDQASLNYLVSRGRESTTYRQIGFLRSRLPIHSYLQYTATPQAPLLINIIDALSPSFAEVLSPGAGYTGGETFFPRGGIQRFIRTIPAAEIFAPGQVLVAPPESYRMAMASFFVGATAGQIRDDGGGYRSMMVHPHVTRNLHASYYVWAESMKADWQRALAAPEQDESRIQVTALLRAAYDDLSTTVVALPSWEEILRNLPRVIRRTAILEVNAARGQTPTIPWHQTYSHILVGGQAMDRGFTVEGLTVTYMPRGLGDGNADTVQQRARFFGYKEGYLGFCRVWLEQTVRDAFAGYVEHEESMRKRLLEHIASDRPLREWKRAFFLDPALRPTRQQVIDASSQYVRGDHSQRWVNPERPHELREVIEHNNGLIDRFVSTLTLVDDVGDASRTIHQRHRVAHGVPLRRAYTDLLEELRLPDPDDSTHHIALLLQISAWLERLPNATCSIFIMRPIATDTIRTRTDDDKVGRLYQGANPPTNYPGDSEIHHPSDLSIQIHTFESRPNAQGEDQNTYPRVSLVATFVPQEVGRSWLVQ
jgi:hypothetical protein